MIGAVSDIETAKGVAIYDIILKGITARAVHKKKPVAKAGFAAGQFVSLVR